MNREFLPLILVSLIVLGIPRSMSQNEYNTCRSGFVCGSLRHIHYPFYGGNRSVSCGYPGFELVCEGEGAPLINISSIIFRVLAIDNQSRVLRVARNDLWGNLCTQLILNTTLDLTFYNFYPPAGDQEITLFYGCSGPLPALIPSPYRFDCTGTGINGPGFYTITMPNAFFTCNAGISVRVNQTAAGQLADPATASLNVLLTSLQSGFSIQWSADNEKCSNCVGSNGTCGFNQTASAFVCYCDHGSYDSTCRITNQNGTCDSLDCSLLVNALKPG